MSLWDAVVLSLLVSVPWSALAGEEPQPKEFPSNFIFGVATSAYQTEGAWNASDKGLSIWDTFTHSKASSVIDGSNGDVAADSYHQWRRDVTLLVQLNVKTYSFSISWPRLLPSGLTNEVSRDGWSYYNDLIDALLDNGIEPMVTLYHWDLPQRLQDLGGWTNPLIIEWFSDYARLAFSLYGDRVKTWITISEVGDICDYAYNTGKLAPGILDEDIGNYICSKNVLLAHATAYRIYDSEFKSMYGGRVSITHQLIWFEPESVEDEEITELVRQYDAGQLHPIFAPEGNWLPIIEEIIDDKSIREGYIRSRLPPLTEEEVELIRGSADFLAISHYTSKRVRRAKKHEEIPPFPVGGAPDLDAILIGDDSDWERDQLIEISSRGIRDLLNWLTAEYGSDIEIVITETRLPFTDPTLEDTLKINYILNYLEEVRLSIIEDNINVVGYIAWSLLDVFEWEAGYTVKNGFYSVDFNSPERNVIPRLSAKFYRAVSTTNSLDVFDEVGNIREVQDEPLD